MRQLALFGTPLTLAVLMLWHSLASSSNVPGTLLPVANWWLTLHVIQLPLCALMGLAISLLLDGRRGLAATISRLAAAVFVVFYNAGDVIAGVTTGILARAAVELPAAQQTALVEAIRIIFGDPTKNLLFDTGIYVGVIALVAAAVALYPAGAPLWPLLLLGLSAYFLMGDHRSPFGPLAFGCFFLAAVWLEVAQRTSILPQLRASVITPPPGRDARS